jgi:hypothetical protein
MLKNLSRERLIVAWLVIVVIAFAGSLMGGTTATPSTWILLLCLCLAPPALSLVIWRGAPPLTVAEILHAASARKDR